jgi:UDP-N-acetyl-2-amino-2-deoxyglucuronate dehydrogenase
VSVGFGIVGSGLMAGIYATCITEDTRGTRLAAIAVGSRAPGLAERFGVDVEPSLEALLARRDVDAVVIATPHSAHLPETLMAARAGKHVFLEKPMALDVGECRQMIDACRSAGVRLSVGKITRRLGAPLEARRLIDAGDVGDVRMIQVWRALAGGLQLPEGSWALDAKEGGAFLDWGSHGCDIVRWYAGAEPVLAFAQYARHDPAERLLPTAFVQFSFANGVLAHIWMTHDLPHAVMGGRARYIVIGSKAILDINAYGQVSRSKPGGWDVVYQSPDWVSADEAWGYPNRYIRDGFARQVQDFADAVSGGHEPEVTGEDGLNAVAMVEAATRSAETGASVPMPL